MNKLEICAVKVRNKLNQVFPSSKKEWFCSAIITAAGNGTRMGGISKQILPLNNKPCIAYSLLAFQNCKEINEIIVTAKASEVDILREIAEKNGITKLKEVIPGGSTRQESVSSGFAAVSNKCDIVAIHDAARPLILADHISELIDNAKRYGSVSAAMPMYDTVKRGDKNGISVGTICRDDLYTVQTPQVFKADLYRVALALAQKDGFTATDDTSLAEHAGFPVKLCQVAPINTKLTTSFDIEIIEALLKGKDNG